MNRTIIVTDFTRFSRPDIVCTAGIDHTTGECIRPMPYLSSARCKELNILPGAILSGDFNASHTRSGPYQEDYTHGNLLFNGLCSTTEFKNVLECGIFNSVAERFEITLQKTQKYIPVGHSVRRSIITIPASPTNIEIVEDSYNPGKIRLNFIDFSGHEYRYISITVMDPEFWTGG